MNNPTIWKVGIAGCGNLAETVYMPQLKQVPNARVTAVYDRYPGRAKAMADKFGYEKWYEDLDTFLSDSDVEIVMSVGAIQGRHEQNMKILRAGKHLYSQKPFAPDVAAATEQIEEAKRQGVLISTAPVHRNRPDIQTAQAAIEKGLIGHPSLLRVDINHGGPEYFQYRMSDPSWFYRKGAGALLDLGIHGVDQAVALMGPATAVTARGVISEPERLCRTGIMDGKTIKTDEIPDNYAITLEFASGALAVITAGFVGKADYRKGGEIEIYGSRGTVCIEGGIAYNGSAPVHLFVDNPETGLRGWIDPLPFDLAPRGEYFQALVIPDLIEAIENGHRSHLYPEMSRHVIEILAAVEQSVETGSRIQLQTTF